MCSLSMFTLPEENFHWSLNFAISPMANSLNLNPVYYYIFRRSLNDIACITENKKIKIRLYLIPSI